MLRYSFNFKKHLLIIAGMVFLLSAVFWSAAGFNMQAHASEYYDYTTDKYKVDMVVHENNTMDVTETIDVNFEVAKHGIYRYIPISGEVYYKHGGTEDTLSAEMKITDISVEGYDYETFDEEGNKVIQIGSPDVTVTGHQRYKISYKCALYDDGKDDFDIFYFNVIPNKWETPIKNPSIHIEMPKTFDDKDLSVYVGYYGWSDSTVLKGNRDAVKLDGNGVGKNFSGKGVFSRNGNKIDININGEMNQGSGITVQSFLSNGYFVGAKSNDWLQWVIIAVSVLTVLAAFIMWLKKGRDEKVFETVEFYPPEGVGSAEIGYIVDGSADKEDVVSLIIYFADKGYLEIEEIKTKRNKTDYVLHKLKDLPQDAKLFEKKFFYGLFSYRESLVISELGTEFYPVYKATLNSLSDYFVKTKKRNIFEKTSSMLHIVSCVMAAIPLSVGIWLGTYYCHDSHYNFFIPFLALPLVIVLFIFANTFDHRNNMKRGRWVALMIVLGLLTLLIIVLSGVCIGAQVNAFTAIVVAVSVAIVTLLMLIMEKRTEYGTEMLGKILGFKNFLKVSEVDRLKLLVDENPKYFYNILPYAYVLGLADKVAKKFENIAMEPPAWYRGYYGDSVFNTWLFCSVFNDCTRALSDNIAIQPKESGGGSFGSGGGFSGGGFGGGGGGSW